LPAAEAAGDKPPNSHLKRIRTAPVAAASAAALHIPTDTPRSRCAERGAELWQRASARNYCRCRLLGQRNGRDEIFASRGEIEGW